MTFIYNDLVGPDGCNTYIKPIYSNLTGIDVDPDATCSNTTATGPDADATGQNLTAIGQDPDFAVSGKMLLGSLLLSDLDPRPFALGLIVSTNISIPGVDNSNITLDQTQDAVGRILKAYLLSFMGNFPLAGYTFMSNNGSLIITD